MNKVANPYETEVSPRTGWPILRVLRPHQWVKNVLVFVPVLVGHRFMELGTLVDAALAFAALSLAASATYIVNDIADVEADRRHPTKRHRPFAAGTLAIGTGKIIVPLLLLGAVGISLLLPINFLYVLGLYWITTLGYTFRLKSVVAMDVVILACLYALRLFAGSNATGVPVTAWLLAFGLFFFLSLAIMKRYAELLLMEKVPEAIPNRRGYSREDLSMLRAIGPACGFMSLLVLAFYTSSPAVTQLYSRPELLWLLQPILLYWTTRMWLMVNRGLMDEEPLLFTAKDPVSYGVGLMSIVIVAAAAVLKG